MNYFHSHIKSAVNIINAAKNDVPFHFQIKKYFDVNKKFGSRDRKTITSFCYQYYRLGFGLNNATTEEKILAAIFLCTTEKSALLETLAPHCNDKINLSTQEKYTYLNLTEKDIFPLYDEMSTEIDRKRFIESFCIQPSLFLRLRPNKSELVLQKLTIAGISFNQIEKDCLALQSGTAIEKILSINNEVVIQDYNSQKVFDYLKKHNLFVEKKITVWDCCAASGGKSILLFDISQKNISITATDSRASILNNLRSRFKEAGVKKYDAFVVNESIEFKNKKFDIIICDVPCSGSGTWARTPEQLLFFEDKSISKFETLQKNIATNASKYLQNDGLFFYITCSIFKRENEDVVEYLQINSSLQLIQKQYLKGYKIQADTMFVAVFEKKNSFL